MLHGLRQRIKFRQFKGVREVPREELVTLGSRLRERNRVRSPIFVEGGEGGRGNYKGHEDDLIIDEGEISYRATAPLVAHPGESTKINRQETAAATTATIGGPLVDQLHAEHKRITGRAAPTTPAETFQFTKAKKAR